MTFETIHIEKMCRTCLSEDNDMRSVFSIDESIGETLRLFEMLMSCAAVQVFFLLGTICAPFAKLCFLGNRK